MLGSDTRDPAAGPRLLVGVLAVLPLWPGIRLAELDLSVLVHPDSTQSMGTFLQSF